MATTKETNTIIQETTFTDGAGEGVMRDVLFRYENTFTTTEGATQSINDVWFMTNAQDTARDSTVILKDSVAALPDYRGAGRAENLSTAMNTNTKLETAVTTLLAKASTSNYASLLGDTKNILALWTHTDNINVTQTRGEQWILDHSYQYGGTPQPWSRYHIFAYARDVAILETLMKSQIQQKAA